MESQNYAFQSVGTVDQKGRDNSSMNNDADKPSFVELGGVDDPQIRRKDLHEVHSGPNPIGNSTPQRQWLPTSHRNP
ncbi:hypothetical protein WN944_014449 [Citrus x changshan-huyou]|uniref:Uncharacterized protein n=1 Tax=Citrus x changshan-huyou TaxID=2935761 RepID=A0AAP0M5P7_9ROSI